MRRNYICLLSIILFLLIICQNVKAFDDSIFLQQLITCESSIVESGVKLQYEVANNFIKEKERIEKILNLDKNIINKNDDKSFLLKWENNEDKYLIKGNKINDNSSFIDIELISTKKTNNVKQLKNKLQKVQNNLTSEEKYFTFLKEKINIGLQDKKNSIYKLLKSKKIKNIEEIPIHNGITSIVHFNDDSKLNYSLCTYDTGNYLIVGTPIIFITY